MTSPISRLNFIHMYVGSSCHVSAGPGPDVDVTCGSCGTPMELARIDNCVGARHDERVLLQLACPSCGSTSQLRVQRDGLGKMTTPIPSEPAGPVEIQEGGAGYLTVRCTTCDPGAGAGVRLDGHRMEGGHVVLHCRSLRCGHRYDLRLPRWPSFTVTEHVHRLDPALHPDPA